MNIQTSHDRPPIPTTAADWSAIDQDTYDGAEDSNCPIGRGATEREAINDLVEQLVAEAEEAAIRDAVAAAKESRRLDAEMITAKDARIAELERALSEETLRAQDAVKRGLALYFALEQAEAVMTVVQPRSDKTEYLRVLGVVRKAMKEAGK